MTATAARKPKARYKNKGIAKGPKRPLIALRIDADNWEWLQWEQIRTTPPASRSGIINRALKVYFEALNYHDTNDQSAEDTER